MIVPVKNIVETVDLTPNDAFLPLFECVVNSIISLIQSHQTDKEIQIKIIRGDYPQQLLFGNNIKTINSIIITDNGTGFNTDNFESFETPFTKINKKYGCKGVGRFTVLAAFKSIHIKSNYFQDEQWMFREFSCDSENEITPISLPEISSSKKATTTIELLDCFNPIIKDRTAITIEEISRKLMQHCLIYYLSNELPKITILDIEDNTAEVINDLFSKVSKENEREFKVGNHTFKAYITKVPKENNRKNHYIYYCANSRVVQSKSIGNINGLFSYPINQNGQLYFLDVYVVSDYLNKKNYQTRNGFSISPEKQDGLFGGSEISFEEIEADLLTVLEDEYESHVKESSQRSIAEVQTYISSKALRYNSLRYKPELLKTIPPNSSEDKIEEYLHKISFNARRNIDKKLQDFIENKQVNEDAIQKIKQDIQEKTAYDIDSLADYMIRRRAIIELFDKFLEADNNGKYRLEEDIHNIIFPIGFTNDEISYESHNLWLLDERFVTYKFIASDKSITSLSQKKSSKEPDVICLNEKPIMFDNPISFGDKSNGEVNSMVIFEFKRPGDVAHQKKKNDYRWEFSELIEPYFDDFLYSVDKKNYKGKHVVVKKETPKFGFIILDVMPPLLEQFNTDKGWNKTPFGTFYKIEPNKNLHIEVMTFAKLIEYARNRHIPFFDKLFGK
ncbi:hypothetical protein HH214_21300 [Mucilaginibacter robiniae]|uniref:ATP-binding protein n=1 Tax=Mucilaginibacter robiniae TaxID=2728022 RepID=A0A7L5EBB1_9SPHI|nr:hypothetical protein [Mucilaginibacter robiniae]QJD98233.1 hypothetical protein HH214_21300 [Mucilaginibacter robiniae]